MNIHKLLNPMDEEVTDIMEDIFNYIIECYELKIEVESDEELEPLRN